MRRRRCGERRGGEVELDPGLAPISGQQTALGMEARLGIRLEMTVFPQHMRARERGVAAEIDFDCRREPAEIVAVLAGNQECCLGEIHLARDVQHPGRVSGFGQNTNGGGVSREGAIGECIYLRDSECHERGIYLSEWCLVSGAWCLGRVGMCLGRVIMFPQSFGLVACSRMNSHHARVTSYRDLFVCQRAMDLVDLACEVSRVFLT